MTRPSRRSGGCCATARRKLTARLAHRSYLDGVAALGLIDRIPDFAEVSDKLGKLTGWEIVAVPGLIPAGPFFEHLANRRFPVTNWLRRRDELDYIVEPDMFHDFFGHVPILTQPAFADFMQLYGKKAAAAFELGGGDMITQALLVHGRVRPDAGSRARR